MKKLIQFSCMLGLSLGIAAIVTSCSELKSEFESAPGQTNSSPASVQLQEAATVVAANPEVPYNVLIAQVLTLLSAGAAAFASFHARKAAVASSSATGATPTPPTT
jgi:hypothetical protein